MTFRIIFLILFALFTVYGAIAEVPATRKLRAHRDYQGVLLAWVRPPTSGPWFSDARTEGGAWVTILIHGFSVVAVGLAECLVLAVRPMRPLLSWGLAGIIVVPAMVMAISMAGRWLGMALFRPLADRIGGDRQFAVSSEGILYLGRLFPWGSFRNFSLAGEGTAVRLWSASFPGLAAMVLIPPPEKLPALLELLRSQLPGEPTPASNGFLAQCASPALMAAVCGPIVLAAWFAFPASAELASILNGFLMLLLGLIGGQGLMQLGFGGKDRPAPIEGNPAHMV
jgi:hypothetical protein